MYNFVHKCLNGDALLDEIDDYVEQWHESDSQDPIYKFLGLTERDYYLWVEKPHILPFLITAYREHVQVDEVVSRSRLSMAARSDSYDRAQQLEEWLKSRGYENT